MIYVENASQQRFGTRGKKDCHLALWDQEERHMVPKVFCPVLGLLIVTSLDQLMLSIHQPADVPSCCQMEIHGLPLICLR